MEVSLPSLLLCILLCCFLLKKNIFLFIFFGHIMACGILFPQPGAESMPPATEVWNSNHLTAREFSALFSCWIHFIKQS